MHREAEDSFPPVIMEVWSCSASEEEEEEEKSTSSLSMDGVVKEEKTCLNSNNNNNNNNKEIFCREVTQGEVRVAGGMHHRLVWDLQSSRDVVASRKRGFPFCKMLPDCDETPLVQPGCASRHLKWCKYVHFFLLVV